MADELHAEGNEMHAIEKILSRASGRRSVSTGQIANCRVDLAEVNDLYPQTIFSFHEMGGKQVHSPDRITFILDHYVPASSIQQVENQKLMREFCSEQGIELLFDVNSGVCHQVMVDHGLVYPGITDHVTSGDILKIDLKEGVVHNQSTEAELRVQPMSSYVFEILESGGIKPLVKKQLAQIN